MKKDKIKELPGAKLIKIPYTEIAAEDVSDKAVERMARGFITGSQSLGRRREIKRDLEDKVVARIGRKGKWLTDKLFELIEGVYIMDKGSGTGKGDRIKYYQVPPKLEAITYALDRVLGKPTQHTEHVEEKRGVMIVESIIRNLAGGKPKEALPAKIKNEGTTSDNDGDSNADGEDTSVDDIRVGEEPLSG